MSKLFISVNLSLGKARVKVGTGQPDGDEVYNRVCDEGSELEATLGNAILCNVAEGDRTDISLTVRRYDL